MGVSFDKIKHEMLKMVPPTLFFFVLLHVVVIVRALMVKGTGISLPTSVSVIVASLILGKAVLLANMLPFINRYPDRPLIWNVAWKTLIYTVVAGVFTISSGCSTSGKRRITWPPHIMN